MSRSNSDSFPAPNDVSATPRTAYLVGICGSGMKALAEVLLDRGYRVSGSDTQAASPAGDALRRRGIAVHPQHAAEQIPLDTGLLVYSSAVQAGNVERRWAADHRVPAFAYHEMLGRLMAESVGVSIAGTHGKSTTTAMTGSILTSAGLQPTVVVGAEVCGLNANGWSGKGPHLVAESCEYQRHFLHLHPQMATILGIEEDHFDCFKDVADTIAAFHEFARQIPAGGLVVIHRECTSSQRGCEGIAAEVQTFSFDTGADWHAVDVQKIPLGHQFRIQFCGQDYCDAQLQIPGRHHILNALAATALCHRAGATAAQIARGIEGFRGIRRRFEVVGEWRGATVVDDYAHHPTAIQATLRAARDEFPDRRLVCVFQPHQVSRTLGLLPDFAASFAAADDVTVLPVYGARETYQQELLDVSQRLAKLIADSGVAARFGESLDQTNASLEDTLRPGDVLLTLGAGDIDRMHHGLNRRLQ